MKRFHLEHIRGKEIIQSTNAHDSQQTNKESFRNLNSNITASTSSNDQRTYKNNILNSLNNIENITNTPFKYVNTYSNDYSPSGGKKYTLNRNNFVVTTQNDYLKSSKIDAGIYENANEFLKDIRTTEVQEEEFHIIDESRVLESIGVNTEKEEEGIEEFCPFFNSLDREDQRSKNFYRNPTVSQVKPTRVLTRQTLSSIFKIELGDLRSSSSLFDSVHQESLENVIAMIGKLSKEHLLNFEAEDMIVNYVKNTVRHDIQHHSKVLRVIKYICSLSEASPAIFLAFITMVSCHEKHDFISGYYFNKTLQTLNSQKTEQSTIDKLVSLVLLLDSNINGDISTGSSHFLIEGCNQINEFLISLINRKVPIHELDQDKIPRKLFKKLLWCLEIMCYYDVFSIRSITDGTNLNPIVIRWISTLNPEVYTLQSYLRPFLPILADIYELAGTNNLACESLQTETEAFDILNLMERLENINGKYNEIGHEIKSLPLNLESNVGCYKAQSRNEAEIYLSLFELYQLCCQLLLDTTVKKLPPKSIDIRIKCIKVFGLIDFLLSFKEVIRILKLPILILCANFCLQDDRQNILKILMSFKNVIGENDPSLKILLKYVEILWIKNPNGEICTDGWFRDIKENVIFG